MYLRLSIRDSKRASGTSNARACGTEQNAKVRRSHFPHTLRDKSTVVQQKKRPHCANVF